MDTFVQTTMETLGPAGVGLLMFLENIFPPLPSELIMPLAGFHARTGESSFIAVLIAGNIGSFLGVLPWYWLGRAFGADRLRRLSVKHGRWLAVTPRDIDRADGWFDRHGAGAVLFGRLVPTVRTLISVPAGMAEMPFRTFALFSAAGTAIWTTALALAGYFLGGDAHSMVSGILGPVSTAVLIACIAVYLYRVATFRPDRQTDDPPGLKSR